MGKNFRHYWSRTGYPNIFIYFYSVLRFMWCEPNAYVVDPLPLIARRWRVRCVFSCAAHFFSSSYRSLLAWLIRFNSVFPLELCLDWVYTLYFHVDCGTNLRHKLRISHLSVRPRSDPFAASIFSALSFFWVLHPCCHRSSTGSHRILLEYHLLY